MGNLLGKYNFFTKKNKFPDRHITRSNRNDYCVMIFTLPWKYSRPKKCDWKFWSVGLERIKRKLLNEEQSIEIKNASQITNNKCLHPTNMAHIFTNIADISIWYCNIFTHIENLCEHIRYGSLLPLGLYSLCFFFLFRWMCWFACIMNELSLLAFFFLSFVLSFKSYV